MHKSRKIIFISGTMILLVFSLAVFINHNYVVPIIMYHSVNPYASSENRIAVTDKTFERQMHFLKEHHYNVVSLETVKDLIKNKKKIPAYTIAITFDDGYKDNYTYAFPILKKYNFPATIFIVVNEVDRPQNDRLSWDEIKIMQKFGNIAIGSHTLDHIYFNGLYSDERLRNEIFDSKRILEGKLGREVFAFSYPGGRFNSKVRQLVIDAGYKTAVATNPGRRFPDDDIFALKRLRISSNSHNLFIFWIETNGFYNFIREHRIK